MTELERYFCFKCRKGLEERLKKVKYPVDKELYRERLEFELGVILEMGFAGYFLVVQDFINWAKKQGILVGPARGSAAGSLACWALGITGLPVDPIPYNLYFERFLNPQRVSMPDIDVDFPKERRDEVIQYTRKKYGYEYVAQIGTFGTFKAKAAIRGATRTLGEPVHVANEIVKHYPKPHAGKEFTLKEAYNISSELAKLRSKPGKAKEILEWAEKLENRVSSFGIHASGVVISDTPLHALVPLAKGKRDEVVTQWDMNEIEQVGLIKFDFLGLKALDLFSKTIEYINKRHNKVIDLELIPIDDEKTFANLRKGDNIGLFQLETSSGMRDLMVKQRPDSIRDLAALVAMYRPGPLCLGGKTKILRAVKTSQSQRKRYVFESIESLYQRYSEKSDIEKRRAPLYLQSLDLNTNQLIKNKIIDVYKSGIKPVYSIQIQTGLTSTQSKYEAGKIQPQRLTEGIEATEDHRFLTLDGWKALKDINPGEYICIAHHSGFGRVLNKKIQERKNFRNICFRNYQYKCVFCDWNLGSLDVNHLEGNRNTNNSPENLCFLCPNHHRMYTEGKISKEEIIREREKYKLPYNDQIMFVKYLGKTLIGEVETYDIQMETPHNNFIANDFVVHNSSPKMAEYLAWRAGEQNPTYHHPDLEPILGETGGWIVYQEQVLQIARDLAGYTLAEADLLRRAVGKKKDKEMAEQYAKFKSGMLKNGYAESLSETLWEEIKAFADYGFNKSHAVAYAVIAYWSAYLKTHYPVEFMAAALTCDSGNMDQMIIYLQECQRMGIDVLPPDVNESETSFYPVGDTEIRFGFSAIKNLGTSPANHITEVRKLRPFIDFFDFCRRVDLGIINKTKLESLVLSGAFDFTKKNRAILLQAIDSVLHYKNEHKKYINKLATYEKKLKAYEQRLEDIKNNVLSDKGKPLKPLKEPQKPEAPPMPSYIDLPEMNIQEILINEKELTGFFMSGHPLDQAQEAIRKSSNTIRSLKTDKPDWITTVALISEIDVKETRTKRRMAFGRVEDLTGTAEFVVFPQVYERMNDFLIKNIPLKIKAEIEYTEAETNEDSIEDEVIPKLKIIEVEPIQSSYNPEEILITIPLTVSNIEKVKRVADKYQGDDVSATIHFITNRGDLFIPSQQFKVKNGKSFRTEIYREINN